MTLVFLTLLLINWTKDACYYTWTQFKSIAFTLTCIFCFSFLSVQDSRSIHDEDSAGGEAEAKLRPSVRLCSDHRWRAIIQAHTHKDTHAHTHSHTAPMFSPEQENISTTSTKVPVKYGELIVLG